MRLFQEPQTKEIWYAVWDKDLYLFSHTTNMPLNIIDIDEIEGSNQALCQDLYRTQWKFNAQGQRKYYYDGELYSRDGWHECIPI